MEPTATTANGAPSHATTMDARLDLFVKTVRDIDESTLKDLVDKSWAVDPLDTLKILFNWRDCRGGKGDYRGFIVAMAYVSENQADWFKANFRIIPEFGSWLDLVKLWHLVQDKAICDQVMQYMAMQLQFDFENMLDADNKEQEADEREEKNTMLPIAKRNKPSLLAKWLPSENSKWDRFSKDPKKRFVIHLCRALFSDKSHLQPSVIKTYRSLYLSPLRAHLKLVETKMCTKSYDEVNYETVPSVAMKKYRKAFLRNDPKAFAEYLEQVKTGAKKINASQVYPHDLVRHYLTNTYIEVDNVIEEQWKALKKATDDCKAFEDAICVCDVSGSMEGTPMQVAIALGLLGLYRGKHVITFSELPQLVQIDQFQTLKDQVNKMKLMDWGGSTNLEKTLDLVLQLCISAKQHEQNQIKRIYIFSDMQFDQAVGLEHTQSTHFQIAKEKFEAAGEAIPQIVFWNLNGQTKDFPITTNDRGVVIMSGYSPALLKAIVTGGNLSPLDMMLSVIRAPRYDSIVSV